MHPLRPLASAVRSLAATGALLLAAGCADAAPGPLDPAFAASAGSAPSVSVATTVAPAEAAAGDSIVVQFAVSNHTGKRLVVTVSETVRDPGGSPVRSRSWAKQTIAAGRTITLVDRFAISPDASPGVYSVGVQVASGNTVYADNAAAGSFRVVGSPASSYKFTRRSDPARTVVSDATGRWLATFTDGARTATLAGPERTFAEPNDTARVTHGIWVRVLPDPFAGQVDEPWLAAALADGSPDVLQTAMQYIAGAPALWDAAGLKIAGDADYGPLQADGTRQEGADFNDYLGISWTYGGVTDTPEPAQLGSLDCSGFVRMV